MGKQKYLEKNGEKTWNSENSASAKMLANLQSMYIDFWVIAVPLGLVPLSFYWDKNFSVVGTNSIILFYCSKMFRYTRIPKRSTTKVY